MSDERLDWLLDQALTTGRIPGDATAEEREQLQPLLDAAARLAPAADELRAEARASMPTARARFERFVAGEEAKKRARETAGGGAGRPSWWERFPLPVRTLAASGVAAAVLIVAAVALFGGGLLVSDTESAYAAELEPGDYVQLDGVVTEVTEEDGTRRVRVESEFGSIEVDLSEETAVVRDDVPGGLSDVHPGLLVRVSGLVDERKNVQAGTLALADGDMPPPPRESFRRVRALDQPILARVIWMKHVPDGELGAAALEGPDGPRVIVTLDGESVLHLVNSQGFAPGAVVRVMAVEGRPGVFTAELVDKPEMRPCERTDIPVVCGVLVGRDGGLLTLETDDGRAEVLVRPGHTRIEVLLVSGLKREDAARPDAGIGHEILAIGGVHEGRFVADYIAIGALFAPPERDR